MGICTICKQPAGIFKNVHKECQELFQNGQNEIIKLSQDLSTSKIDYKNTSDKINSIASKSFISKNLIQKLLIKGWEKAVETAFEDGFLSVEEQDNLMEFSEKFNFDQNELDKNGYYSKLVKGSILREVMEGKIPDNVKIDFQLPFNFQKTEKVLWLFQNVKYYEQKTKRNYVGGSQGVSIRIAKGIYYRAGGFKGERVDSIITKQIDDGLLVFTNKHIYFSGARKSFRINYNKIISFKPYSDGIEIHRDALTAKPQSFLTGDGWFTYNLLINLANMAKAL